MQRAIFDTISESSQHGPLGLQQIEKLARDFLIKHHNEITEVGTNAILRWVVWMAWHEGCLKYDPAVWNRALPYWRQDRDQSKGQLQ
jgi:hypothetical protein